MKHPYLIVFLLVFFGVIDIAILGNRFGLDETTWPGWVQAIGSISALGVAVFVMTGQNAHAMRLFGHADRTAIRRRAGSIGVLVRNGDRAIRSAFSHMLLDATDDEFPNVNIGNIEIWMDSLSDAKRILESAPIHELGSEELITAAIDMLDDLAHVTACFKDWKRDGVDPNPIVFKQLADSYPTDRLVSFQKYREAALKLQQL